MLIGELIELDLYDMISLKIGHRRLEFLNLN